MAQLNKVPTFTLTVSLVAVFIPLLFMGGIVGPMFREFALTLTITVITSAIVSLTLTPMMCSRLLRQGGELRDNAVTRFFNGLVDGAVTGYHRSLEWVDSAIRRRGISRSTNGRDGTLARPASAAVPDYLRDAAGYFNDATAGLQYQWGPRPIPTRLRRESRK